MIDEKGSFDKVKREATNSIVHCHCVFLNLQNCPLETLWNKGNE